MSAPAQPEMVQVLLHALPEYEPPLRLVPPDPAEPDDPTAPYRPPADPPPVPGVPVWDEPGPVREQLRRLIGMVLEAFDARRPAEHLGRLVAPELSAALRSLSRQAGLAGRQHRLRSLHTCRPAEGVIELCGTVTVSTPGTRTAVIALAARAERHGDSWVFTALRCVYGSGRAAADRLRRSDLGSG